MPRRGLRHHPAGWRAPSWLADFGALDLASHVAARARIGIRELFVLGALTTCLAMAWFTARLEFSLALGAFLAGVLGEGVPVLFGDAAQKEILELAGVEDAKIVVFAISDFGAVRRSLKAARELSRNIQILVRTSKFEQIEDLREAGANQVVAEEFESAIDLSVMGSPASSCTTRSTGETVFRLPAT